ncbi:SPFH domain-containing protein [Planomonospora sp. ID82291]|uniref:SPFH domain-containing protein n=1 Tax=Planomonospora sp. ID82291 TaxID=2738136 RepID=UPI0018C35BAE|nr:SPFH domain-containing protein [Planomonospora sp. ID82291]MBG0813415.1 SPFH domain-containing protein [Planomonospora sp. ID82291]
MTVLGNDPQTTLAVEALPAWIVAGTVALGALAALASCSVRLVRPGERLVVFRLGRPAGVRGPGIVLVLPLLERGVRVPLHPVRIDLLWLEATTRDGVAVTVNGAVFAAVRDPVRHCLAGESPLSAVTAAAEDGVRRHVAGRDLAELYAPPGGELREPASRITGRTRELGVEVTRVELGRIEVPLSTGLIRWAEGFSARTRPAARSRPSLARTRPAARSRPVRTRQERSRADRVLHPRP